MSSLAPILNTAFARAAQQLPSDTRPVLALRPSSYSCCQYEVVTARYMPAYRPLAPWRDLSGDDLADSGSDQVLAWASADAILIPGSAR
ncbi:hypothetical protein [Sphingomonas sp. CCH18-B1]|jgi:hypothetical protein|uniref:hypothetical protein n=1 Tax=Sphingomonas sp. CCH18-B1 TaxID=1768744 RepID=UPI00083120B0|nr:hypothetical protein [Sphingomonas sp. CCH18-B1]